MLIWLEKIPEAKLTTEDHGKRKRLEVVKEMVDQDVAEQMAHPDMGEKLVDMNRDMWAILQEKTEGTTYDKVNLVMPGEGLYAYVKMHQ